MSATTTHKFGSLFAKQAHLYAAYRPSYPKHLYDAIYKYKLEYGTPTYETAADIACGSGQAAIDLAVKFTRVIGIDASAEQVAQAPPAGNIVFRQGTSESTGLDRGSVDLIAVAQAFHWFETHKFYTEAARILKPKGTLAIWAYCAGSPMHVEQNTPENDEILPVNIAARDAFMDVYTNHMTRYFAPQIRAMVDNKYAGMEPGEGTEFHHVSRYDTHMDKIMPLAALTQYMWSWSAHVTYMEKTGVTRGSERDIIMHLQRKFVDIFAPERVPSSAGVLDERVLRVAEETRVCMRWPVGLMLATRK
eukprot:GDKI01042597.1.p1 GENE.GDKI01042597.1~~GDKI01042597.1.p1  ORF type:complete len:305 (-),score=44.72 GDKI01042597.1:97-1011(-)